MPSSLWPMKTAPRHIANHAMEQIAKAKPKTPDETWAIVDETIQQYPGCLAGLVRQHVWSALVRKHGYKPFPEAYR